MNEDLIDEYRSDDVNNKDFFNAFDDGFNDLALT
jgi:hypothetical protein